MARIQRSVLALAALAAPLSCAFGTQQMGREIDAAKVAELRVGTSTKADVLELFGPPTVYSNLPPQVLGPGSAEAGETLTDVANVFVYEFREDREAFFTVLFFTRFQRQVLADRLMVFFDADDVVRHAAFAQQTDAP